jgi:GDP-L-fucose synthase
MSAMPRIVVTGGTGFFGAQLRARLGGAVLAPTRRQLELGDAGAVHQYLRRVRPAAVVHAAGFVGGIQLNAAVPGRMAVDNLRMGLNLLDAAARLGGIHVVIVSTVCAYPASAPVPTPEEALWAGYPAEETAAYGLAKRELLSVAGALRQELGFAYSYLIPANLYGPGDHLEPERSHVVPALIRRIHEARTEGRDAIVLWGDGTATRDLLFVEDAADGVARALARGPLACAVNLGSGVETSVRELAETLCALMGFRGRLVFDAARPAGAPRRLLDTRRAGALLGWRARTPLRLGLARTVRWFEAEMAKERTEAHP